MAVNLTQGLIVCCFRHFVCQSILNFNSCAAGFAKAPLEQKGRVESLN